MSTNTRFKITDIDNEYFYQMPKSLFTQKNYRGLSSDAKIIYCILKDRMSLSRKNNWKDANGDIYLVYKQEKMAEILGMSVSTVSRIMKQLTQFSLAEVIRQGLNRPNKIYIHKIEVVEDEANIQDIDCMFSDEENTENDNNDKSESVDTMKYDKTRTCKNENPDLQNCKSGLAEMKIKTCRNENQDLQEWESRFAPVQTNNNSINNNILSQNYKDNNKENVVVNFVTQERTDITDFTQSAMSANIITTLCDLGFKQEQALELCQIYSMTQIQDKLNMLKKQKDVKNCIGWLLLALRDNYVQKKMPTMAFSSPGTLDNGRSRTIPLSPESAEYEAACAETACSIDPKSPFYQSFLRLRGNVHIDPA